MANLKLRILSVNRTVQELDVHANLAVKVESGATYSVVDGGSGAVISDIVVKRVSDSLVLEQGGERLVVIQEYYSEQAFVDVGEGNLLTSSSPVAEGTNIVWEAGQAMGLQGVDLASAGGGLGKLLGAGLAAFASGLAGLDGGGSGDVEIFVAGGPVILGNDLVATFYEADGVTVLGTGNISSTGTLALNVGDYEGVVMVKVVSSSNAVDYIDETTGVGKDIGDFEYWSDGIQIVNGKAFLNVNILSTIAHMLAVQANGGLGEDNPMTLETVNETNTAVAEAFGIPQSEMHSRDLITTVDKDGAADPAANVYGQVLAMFSAMDSANGGDIQASVNSVVNGIDFREGAVKLAPGLVTDIGTAATLAATKVAPAIAADMAGRATAIAAKSDGVARVFADTQGPSVQVRLSDYGAEPGDQVTVTFLFNEVPTGFDADTVTVVGGTLGNITPVSNSDTRFQATLTVGSDAKTLKIKVDGTEITDASNNQGYVQSFGFKVVQPSSGGGAGDGGAGGGGAPADPNEPTFALKLFDANGDPVDGYSIDASVARVEFTVEFPAGVYDGSTIQLFMDQQSVASTGSDGISADATSYTFSWGADAGDVAVFGNFAALMGQGVTKPFHIVATPKDGSDAYTVDLAASVVLDTQAPNFPVIAAGYGGVGGTEIPSKWNSTNDTLTFNWTQAAALDAGGDVTVDWSLATVVGNAVTDKILLKSEQLAGTATSGSVSVAWSELSAETQQLINPDSSPKVFRLIGEVTDGAGNKTVSSLSKGITVDMIPFEVTADMLDLSNTTNTQLNGFVGGVLDPDSTNIAIKVGIVAGSFSYLTTDYAIAKFMVDGVQIGSDMTMKESTYRLAQGIGDVDAFIAQFPNGGSIDVEFYDNNGNKSDYVATGVHTFDVPAAPLPHVGADEVIVLDTTINRTISSVTGTQSGGVAVAADKTYAIYVVLDSNANEAAQSFNNLYIGATNALAGNLGGDDKIIFVTDDGQSINDGAGNVSDGQLHIVDGVWKGQTADGLELWRLSETGLYMSDTRTVTPIFLTQQAGFMAPPPAEYINAVTASTYTSTNATGGHVQILLNEGLDISSFYSVDNGNPILTLG